MTIKWMFSSISDAAAKPKVTAMPLITTISTYINRRAKFQNVSSWYMTTADISMKQLGNWINQKTQIGECLFCFLFLFHFMFVCVCVCVCVCVLLFFLAPQNIIFSKSLCSHKTNDRMSSEHIYNFLFSKKYSLSHTNILYIRLCLTWPVL